MWKFLTVLLLLSPKTGIYSLPRPSLPDRIIDCAPSTPDPAITCAPPASAAILPDADGRFAPPLPGWGHHHYPIATTSDSAQYYFDQGLSLYYSYHFPEAAASFREAARHDSGCVMAWWGQALALGPYYNTAYFYKMPASVLPVLDKMNLLAAAANPKEKNLIAALNHRYSTDTTDSQRTRLNQDYADAMKSLAAEYPSDNDIKALYIDGVMTVHAWDTWDNTGHPKPWTPELVSDCEAILKSDPDHPAALHYHIHLLEASPHPEATLASADRLKTLMPGVAHMVHMTSHSYQRTGQYVKGVTINDSANAAQRNYSVLLSQLHLSTDVLHYDAVETFCAMTGAMYDKAMQNALKCRIATTSRASASSQSSRPAAPNTNVQYISMMPVFVQLRMGKWQIILDQPIPDDGWIYSSLLSHFARGMAYLRTGNEHAATACLDSIRKEINDPSLRHRTRPFNEAIKGASVAEGILAAEIFASRSLNDSAQAAFRRAITNEDEMSYLEPQEWPLPARQFAGAFLLHIGKPAEAENFYREDLAQNPGNGWSLLGLNQSLTDQHKPQTKARAAAVKAAFAHADAMPRGSVY
jgi:tetratricopeptide (TPR) repeat protein